MLELYGSGGILGHKVPKALAVLFEFGHPHFNLGDACVVYGGRGLGGVQGGVYDVGTGFGVLQCGLGLHDADAVFAVVKDEEGVAFLHVLVFGEADAADVARGTEIDGRDVLFHLCVVAGFVALVVEEDGHHLYKSPYEDGDTEEAGNELSAALPLEFLGLTLVIALFGILDGVPFILIVCHNGLYI